MSRNSRKATNKRTKGGGTRGIMESSFSVGGGAPGAAGVYPQQQQQLVDAGGQNNSRGAAQMTYGHRGLWQPPSQHPVHPHHQYAAGAVDHRGAADPLLLAAGAAGQHPLRQHQQHMPSIHQPPPQVLGGQGGYHHPPPPQYYPAQQHLSAAGGASFHHHQQQPPPPHPPVASPIASGGSNPVAGGAMNTAAAVQDAQAGNIYSAGTSIEGILAPHHEDIERGLRIDFYTERDPTLLASWASFFRDRFLEVRHELTKATFDRNAETYRRATHFVERVESKVLDSSAIKQLFRKYPLTPINDPLFIDTCYRAIIDYSSRNPPFDGFAFGNPVWRDYMWFKAGLMKLVDDSRNQFLEWYAQKIQDTIEAFIEAHSSSKSSKTEKDLVQQLVPERILEASNSGMLGEAAYTHTKRFYVFLFKEVLSELDQLLQETTNESPTAPELIGKRVRDCFGLAEEAFVLSVLRYYLDERRTLQEQRQDAVGKKDGPSSSGDLPQGDKKNPSPSTGANVVSSRLLATAVEISQMLATQEASVGFDSPFIHFNKKDELITTATAITITTAPMDTSTHTTNTNSSGAAVSTTEVPIAKTRTAEHEEHEQKETMDEDGTD